MWTIDEAVFQGKDVKYDLLVNMVEFKGNGSCYLPVTLHQENQDKSGLWTLTKNDSKTNISINSSNELFHGFYEIYFHNDDDAKLLKLVLKSDSSFFILSKLLHDFDKMK